MQKVKSKYGHCLKMATYLQLPVLHVTKYHLLLQRYLKLLDCDTFAHKQVLEALELMKEVNDKINKQVPGEQLKSASNISENSTRTSLQQLINLFGSIIKQVWRLINL
jgi:hypothetical protein